MVYGNRRLKAAAVCMSACLLTAGLAVVAVFVYRAQKHSSTSTVTSAVSTTISNKPFLSLPLASSVTSTAFSPDGKTLVAETEDGSVELRSARTGKLVASISPKGGNFGSFAISPDGKTLAVSAGTAGKYMIDFFTMKTRKMVRSLPLNVVSVTSVAFSPDGRTLAVGGGTNLVLLDLQTRSSLVIPDTPPNDTIDGVFNPDGEATYVRFSSNGDWLLVAGTLGEIRLWNVRTSQFAKTIFVGPSGRQIPSNLYPNVDVDAVSISPNGSTVAIGGSTNTENGQYEGATLWLWNTKSKTAASLINYPVNEPDADDIAGVAFNAQGTLLATGDSSGTVQLWNIGEHQVISTSYSPTIATSNVSFSPDGKTLAAGQWVPVKGSNLGTGALELWKIDQSRVLAPVTFKDLLSAPVPAICEHTAGKLSAGAQPRIPQYEGATELAWLATAQPQRSQLTAFGSLGGGIRNGAAVVLDCNAGGVPWPQVVAFYGPGPTLLGWAYLTNFSLPGKTPGQDTEVWRISYHDEGISAEWSTQDDGDAAATSTLDYSAELRLVDGKVIATGLAGTTELPTAQRFLRDLRTDDEAGAARLATSGVAAAAATQLKGQSAVLSGTLTCFGGTSINVPATVAPLLDYGSATAVNPMPDRTCVLPAKPKWQWVVLGMRHTGFRKWQVAWVRVV